MIKITRQNLRIQNVLWNASWRWSNYRHPWGLHGSSQGLPSAPQNLLWKPLVFLGTLCTTSSGDMWVRKEAHCIRTYLFKISPRSFWSSRERTERSEILTVAEAVRVTSRTRWPSPSSSCNSSLWVCSLLRDDRSTWHLETNVLN